MTHALRLTLQRDADGYCRLDCEARHDGFAGRGQAWFSTAEIRCFCESLDTYPLPPEGIALAGGHGLPEQQRVVTLGLTIRPTDGVGGLDLLAELADFPASNDALSMPRSALVRIPVSYEALRTFATALRALLDGAAATAILDAAYEP